MASTDLSDTANIVLLTGSQTISGTKTLNSFKGTGAVTVTNILDEDNLVSDSATALATQQSIKAYVDGGAGDEVFTWTNDHVAADNDLLQVDNITSGADNEHNWDVSRDATLADDATIGSLRFRAKDGADPLVLNSYATVHSVMVSDADGAEEGSLVFSTMIGGALTDSFCINSGTTDRIRANLNIEAVGDAVVRRIDCTTYGASANFRQQRAEGTEALPTVVTNNKPLGGNQFFGWDGSAFVSGGRMRVRARATWSGTERGSEMDLATVADGGTTQSLRIQMDDVGDTNILNGNLGVDAGSKIYLDGISNTYIYQESADDVHLVVGDIIMQAWDQDLLETQFAEGVDFVFGTTTGTIIGTGATQKIGFYGTTAVVQPTALTAASTTLTNAGTASDFAIQAMTQTTPFGFVTQAEGETVVDVVLNNQARINEIETKLQALGLLA